MEPDYVKKFEEQQSHRLRSKQPEYFQFPDDQRLKEKPRRVRLEPPSQIQQQSIFHAQQYSRDSYLMKPLVNAQVSPQSNIKQEKFQHRSGNVRYNHNFSYFGNKYRSEENIFKQEPYNQPQSDYNSQFRQSGQQLHQENDKNRMNYSQVGSMLMNNQATINSSIQNPLVAGTPNQYKEKSINQQPNQLYYRALKNLDSTQTY